MTRKIEDAMIAAIRAGKDWKSGNTEVRREEFGGSLSVYLHGNLIAKIGGAQEYAHWTLAGWDTNTTRSRINALARAFGWRGVSRKGGVPFASGSATAPMTPISDSEWVDALA